jgi:hypothetical protein
MLPRPWQDAARAAHADLYAEHPEGFVHLRVVDGQLDLSTLNRAPFGVAPLLELSGLTPLVE